MGVQEIAIAEQAPRLPSIQAGGAVRAIVPQDFDAAWRIANAVVKSGMAPRGIDSAEKAMVAIMHGLEVGMTPMMALQSIASINGRPSIWGDGALGLVQGSGLMEWHKEYYRGEPDTDAYTAVCEVKRRHDPEVKVGEFSIADAKAAGLFGKEGPWKTYRKRMLKMRARGFALRDGFADVLRGLHIAEEAQDIPIRDVTPHDEPPEPPPVSQLAAPEPTAVAVVEPTRSDGDPPMPDVADTGAFLAWIQVVLSAIEDGEALETKWNDKIAPHIDQMFPGDQEDALGIYRQHEARLAP
jgi:hypothetical protein